MMCDGRVASPTACRDDGRRQAEAQQSADYALGYSERELQRLIRQSALYADLTETLLRNAGIGEGMRVLDVGCGSGCVSLLAARLVGPAGAVVGVDRSPEALALANRRVAAAGLRHVEFMQGDLADLGCRHGFDALIGRFVLMFLPNPAAVLRKLSCYVRKGGVVAFQEMDISASRTMPEMPLVQQYSQWIRETFQRARVDIQMGPKLYATFLHAGLPPPQMQMQAKIGGAPAFPAHQYIADIAASLLPMMERQGVATAAEVDVATLAARLQDEMLSREGTVMLPPIVGAWATVPA